MITAPTQKLLLPYQRQWLKDIAPLKIAEKSRRVGFTYTQALEDVLDATNPTKPMDVWFSSADDNAAGEYIKYCASLARVLNIVATEFGEHVVDEKRGLKARTVQFTNGKSIYGLSSNPRAYRSKGGKVVLDEFAFHDNAEELYKATRPAITWGFPLRILSTYNGTAGLYYRMVQDAKLGKNGFSVHTVTIMDALNAGLLDKILKRKATKTEKEVWLAEIQRSMTPDDFNQEYLCIPSSNNSTFFPYYLIMGCEAELTPYMGGFCSMGVDVAIRGDLFSLAIMEHVGDVATTREIIAEKGLSFKAQEDLVAQKCTQYNIIRIAYDQTGMGEKVVEDAKRRFGNNRVEGILFTNASKHYLATSFHNGLTDKKIRLPANHEVREDLHSIKKTTLPTGTVRLDADRTSGGHADMGWASMLAYHGLRNGYRPVEIQHVAYSRPARIL